MCVWEAAELHGLGTTPLFRFFIWTFFFSWQDISVSDWKSGSVESSGRGLVWLDGYELALSWVIKQTLHGFQPRFKVSVTSAGQWLNACPPISTWHLGLHKSDLCFPWSCLLLVPYPVWASWFFLLFQGSALFVEYLNHVLALLAGSVCPCGLLGVCSSLPSVRKILRALHTVLLHLSEL